MKKRDKEKNKITPSEHQKTVIELKIHPLEQRGDDRIKLDEKLPHQWQEEGVPGRKDAASYYLHLFWKKSVGVSTLSCMGETGPTAVPGHVHTNTLCLC